MSNVTVKIKKSTHAKLTEIGSAGQNSDDIIKELLRVWNEEH